MLKGPSQVEKLHFLSRAQLVQLVVIYVAFVAVVGVRKRGNIYTPPPSFPPFQNLRDKVDLAIV